MNYEQEDESEFAEGYRHGVCEFLADTLGLHVQCSRDDAPFNKPELHEAKPLDFPLRGRFAHEEDHLLRSLGTSWGIVAHILQGRCLLYYLGILASENLRDQLGNQTLAKLLRKVCRLDSDSLEIINGNSLVRRLHVLSRELDLRRALMGFLPYGPVSQLGNTITRIWGPATFTGEIKALFPQPPNDKYNGQAIRAAEILESLAIIKEDIYGVTYREVTDGEVLRNASIAYSFALGYGRAYLEHLFDWEVQAVEVEAALNLALWPPVLPDGLSPLRPWRWEDIEPGHRYCQIIDWLDRRAKQLTNHDSLTQDGRNELFKQFFEEASSALNWVPPMELADAWIEHLKQAIPWGRTKNTWWCLGEGRLRTKYALQLLTEFRRRPFDAWFPVFADKTKRPTFSYICYNDMLEVPEQHCDQSGKTITGRLESYVFRGMRQVLDRPARSEFEKNILEQHFHVIPLFIDSTSEKSLVVQNCEFLKGCYLV